MEVIFVQLFIFLLSSHISSSDWVSEWMSPIQDHLEVARRRSDGDLKKPFEVKEERKTTTPEPKKPTQLTAVNLMVKLDQTMHNAMVLGETLQLQIRNVVERETKLKDAITAGRRGVTALTVMTSSRVLRAYIIRDGQWMTCNGFIQYPVVSQTPSSNFFSGLFSEPRCIGKLADSGRDPCVFNSVIKYEVIPTVRAPEYTEEEVLCLKPTFNTTMERYMSVTRRIVNDTCKDGVVRTLADNTLQCGVRTLSEYSYYPYRSSAAATLPLEYCVEKDGACKLTVAWHLTNETIENFEFLKEEHHFKKYFLENAHFFQPDK